MKQLFIVVIVLGAFAGSGSQALACSCAGDPPACQEYWEVSAVFVGTVINSRTVRVKDGDYEHEMRSVRISLDETFRGIEGAEAEVLTGFGGGDCGFGFRQAQQYLVYAYRSESDGKLYTSICSRTRSIADAAKDLAYIRGLDRARHGGTISGEVMKYLRNETGGLANQPLAGTKVTFTGESNYETVTNAKGQFSLSGIQPGEYVVKAEGPPGLAARGPDKKVTLADRGCAQVGFWLESNAEMSGRVLNPQGLPVAGAEIFMIEADKEKYRGHWDAAYADADGKYSFKFIPPGRYNLQIRYDGVTSQTRPFPTVYFPGVADKSQAMVFTFAEGRSLAKDLVMPPMPAEYLIEGRVVSSNGTPVVGARIEYMFGNEPIVYGANVDNQGQFSIKAYEGLDIGLRASLNSSYSNGAQVHVGSGMSPVKLVFPGP